jgi:hypothetical protein
MEISIHRALAELKLLDKRITKLINESPLFCLPKKKDEKWIGKDTLSEYNKKVEGNFDSINSLIARKEQIKSKIMYSNAITKVVVAGEEMTVAEAIERKNNIEYKKSLLNRLKKDLYVANNQIENESSKLPDKLESFLKATLGDNPSIKEVEAVSKMFMENNALILHDPINVENKIKILEKEIDEFLMEVDFVLSESNSVTKISIED